MRLNKRYNEVNIMKIDIDEIANDCVENLMSLDCINIDNVYDEAHNAVEEIMGDIALKIKDKLEQRNIEVKE